MIPAVLVRLLMRTFVSGRRRFENVIGEREFEDIKVDTQIGKWILRAMPMKIAFGSGGLLRIAVVVPHDQSREMPWPTSSSAHSVLKR